MWNSRKVTQNEPHVPFTQFPSMITLQNYTDSSEYSHNLDIDIGTVKIANIPTSQASFILIFYSYPYFPSSHH